MNVLVVEPHADDALLSSLSIIKGYVRNGDNVDLLTITNSTPRGYYRDSRIFCAKMDCNFIDDNNYIPQVFYDDCMKYISGVKSASMHRLFLIYNYHMSDYYNLINRRVQKYINLKKYQLVITNYGILHATHIFTRVACEHWTQALGIRFVCSMDIPYYDRVHHDYGPKDDVILLPCSHGEKRQLFYECYPSETYMESLYPNIYDMPEVVFENPGPLVNDKSVLTTGE